MSWAAGEISSRDPKEGLQEIEAAIHSLFCKNQENSCFYLMVHQSQNIYTYFVFFEISIPVVFFITNFRYNKNNEAEMKSIKNKKKT